MTPEKRLAHFAITGARCALTASCVVRGVIRLAFAAIELVPARASAKVDSGAALPPPEGWRPKPMAQAIAMVSGARLSRMTSALAVVAEKRSRLMRAASTSSCLPA